MPPLLDRTLHSLQDSWERGADYARDHIALVALLGAGTLLVGGYCLSQSKRTRKPATTQLTGGGIARSDVKREFKDYSAAYGERPGEGIKERNRTTELVDTFCAAPGSEWLCTGATCSMVFGALVNQQTASGAVESSVYCWCCCVLCFYHSSTLDVRHKSSSHSVRRRSPHLKGCQSSSRAVAQCRQS